MSEPVGFIGLGNIGEPMAERVLAAGHRLIVHDLSAERVGRLTAAGAMSAATPAALAAQCRAVLLSLPTSREVEAVTLGKDGIAAGGRTGLLVIDLTSGDPASSRAIAARLAASGIRYVDAGVSGGRAGAAVGTLGIMLGGAEADVEEARPLLECFGKSLTHLGAIGAGHLTKSLNNLVMAANMAALSEALCVAVKAGLEPKKVVAAISASSGGSWISQFRFPNFVLKGDFSGKGGMALSLLQKDVGIACEAAKQQGLTLFVGALVQQMLLRIAHEIGPDLPNQSVARAIASWAGVSFHEER